MRQLYINYIMFIMTRRGNGKIFSNSFRLPLFFLVKKPRRTHSLFYSQATKENYQQEFASLEGASALRKAFALLEGHYFVRKKWHEVNGITLHLTSLESLFSPPRIIKRILRAFPPSSSLTQSSMDSLFYAPPIVGFRGSTDQGCTQYYTLMVKTSTKQNCIPVFQSMYCVCVCVCVCVCYTELPSRLIWTSGLWTNQPGSHRRKVTKDFCTFLLRCLP